MKKNELKIKMIESYLSLHRQLNQLRLEYVSKKSTFTNLLEQLSKRYKPPPLRPAELFEKNTFIIVAPELSVK